MKKIKFYLLSLLLVNNLNCMNYENCFYIPPDPFEIKFPQSAQKKKSKIYAIETFEELSSGEDCFKKDKDISKYCRPKGKKYYTKKLKNKYTKIDIGHVIYFISNINLKHAYINYIYITKEFRRKGYGTILLKEVFRHLLQLDCEFLYLDISLDNLIGELFFKKNGFESLEFNESMNNSDTLLVSSFILKKTLWGTF